MVCKNCGARLYTNAKFCAHCGSAVKEIEDFSAGTVIEEPQINQQETTHITETIQQPTPKIEQNTQNPFSGKAITGVVVSLVGMLFAGIPCGIIGIIFSSLAMSDIKRKNYRGKGFAIAGLVVSIVGLVISVFIAIDTIITYINLLYYY